MNLHHFNYIFSIIIFAGTAILIEWHRNKRVLKKYELIILFLAAVSVPFTATDYFALKWHAWFYYPGQNLDIKFITQAETYLFAIAVTVFSATVTLIYAARQDRKLNHRSSSNKRRKSGPRRGVRAAAAAKR